MLVELVKGSIGFSNSQSSLNTLQCLRISFEVFCVSNDSHATEFNVFARSNSGVFIIGIVKVFPLHTPISSFIDYHISDQGSALEGTKACRLTHEMVVTLSSRSDTKSLLVRIFAFIVNVFQFFKLTAKVFGTQCEAIRPLECLERTLFFSVSNCCFNCVSAQLWSFSVFSVGLFNPLTASHPLVVFGSCFKLFSNQLRLCSVQILSLEDKAFVKSSNSHSLCKVLHFQILFILFLIYD